MWLPLAGRQTAQHQKALEAVVRKAMAGRPAGRYASARSLAADIDHWLAGEPVSAWHEPLLVRARRWIRRHQTAATGIAAAAAVAVAGLMAVSVVQAEANLGLRDSNRRLADSLTRTHGEMPDQTIDCQCAAVRIKTTPQPTRSSDRDPLGETIARQQLERCVKRKLLRMTRRCLATDDHQALYLFNDKVANPPVRGLPHLRLDPLCQGRHPRSLIQRHAETPAGVY